MNKQEYLLNKAQQECQEVAQRISKAMEFGLDEKEPGQDLNNAQRIRYEWNDLKASMVMLENEIGIDLSFCQDMINNKINKVNHYSEYSKKLGCLVDKFEAHTAGVTGKVTGPPTENRKENNVDPDAEPLVKQDANLVGSFQTDKIVNNAMNFSPEKWPKDTGCGDADCEAPNVGRDNCPCLASNHKPISE